MKKKTNLNTLRSKREERPQQMITTNQEKKTNEINLLLLTIPYLRMNENKRREKNAKNKKK